MSAPDSDRFDGFFATMASNANGIDNLMDAFFGFLSRKTDFYNQSADRSDDPARKVTLQYFEKHRATAVRRLEEERRNVSKNKEKQAELEFQRNQQKLREAPRVCEVFDEDEEVQPVKIEEKKKEQQQQSATEGEGDSDGGGEGGDSVPPVGNGGKTDK